MNFLFCFWFFFIYFCITCNFYFITILISIRSIFSPELPQADKNKIIPNNINIFFIKFKLRQQSSCEILILHFRYRESLSLFVSFVPYMCYCCDHTHLHICNWNKVRWKYEMKCSYFSYSSCKSIKSCFPLLPSIRLSIALSFHSFLVRCLDILVVNFVLLANYKMALALVE